MRFLATCNPRWCTTTRRAAPSRALSSLATTDRQPSILDHLASDLLLHIFRCVVGNSPDPLIPPCVAAFALTATCRRLHEVLRPALRLLKGRYLGVGALCLKLQLRRRQLHGATLLQPPKAGMPLAASDLASLGRLIEGGSLVALEGLSLYKQHVGGPDMQPVIEALAVAAKRRSSLPRLRALNLGGNSLGDEFCTGFATALCSGAGATAALPALTILDLSSNMITSQGLALIVPALGALGGLRLLSLANNELDDTGLLALLGAASSPGLRSLEVLHLHGNVGISDEGVDALAAALRAGGLPALKTLEMPEQHEEHQAILISCSERKVRCFFW